MAKKQEIKETKADKFKRLAEQRTTKVLTGLKQLEALSGPAYESTPEQVDEIVNIIIEAANNLKKTFSQPKSKSKVEFKFSS